MARVLAPHRGRRPTSRSTVALCGERCATRRAGSATWSRLSAQGYRCRANLDLRIHRPGRCGSRRRNKISICGLCSRD
jgi:hypothetical protein